MKPYPSDEFRICDDVSREDGVVFLVPTKEALRKFFDYLDQDERRYYDGLDAIDQLSIRISVNPFNALLSKMGKL